MKDYKVNVFNTFTGEYEMVKVTKEVYEFYMHDQWNTEKATSRFYDHHITATYLAKGNEEFLERTNSFNEECMSAFREETRASDIHEMINEAMKVLSTSDRNLIQAIYCDGYTEKEYAEKIGINQSNVHRRKKKILEVLRKELEKFS